MTTNFAEQKKEMNDGTKVISIDTEKAVYRGKKWESLSNFEKSLIKLTPASFNFFIEFSSKFFRTLISNSVIALKLVG